MDNITRSESRLVDRYVAKLVRDASIEQYENGSELEAHRQTELIRVINLA